MAEGGIQLQADEATRHQRGLRAARSCDFEKIREANFIPKSQDSWDSQYLYDVVDRSGNPIPLTGEVIDQLLREPYIGVNTPKLSSDQLQTWVILGDALLLPDFVDPFLISCQSGLFLNIYPHSYGVKSNEPLFNKTKIGFVKVVNMSRNALTINSLMAEDDLYLNLLHLQPDVISFNIGLSDMMLENVSWHKSQIPKEFIKQIKNLIISFHTYFTSQGKRGYFCEKLVYTYNMMPIYCALDGQQQRKCTAEQVIQHENLWGTSWYLIDRQFYKICSDEINKRLHAGKQSMFEKYQMVLLNPTPRWDFEDIHVCRKSGLPLPEFHNLMIWNFLFCISRAVCDQKFCTIGVNSSRSKRETNSLLYEGCVYMYEKAPKTL